MWGEGWKKDATRGHFETSDQRLARPSSLNKLHSNLNFMSVFNSRRVTDYCKVIPPFAIQTLFHRANGRFRRFYSDFLNHIMSQLLNGSRYTSLSLSTYIHIFNSAFPFSIKTFRIRFHDEERDGFQAALLGSFHSEASVTMLSFLQADARSK